jgi:hypothetical protein
MQPFLIIVLRIWIQVFHGDFLWKNWVCESGWELKKTPFINYESMKTLPIHIFAIWEPHPFIYLVYSISEFMKGVFFNSHPLSHTQFFHKKSPWNFECGVYSNLHDRQCYHNQSSLNVSDQNDIRVVSLRIAYIYRPLLFMNWRKLLS